MIECQIRFPGGSQAELRCSHEIGREGRQGDDRLQERAHLLRTLRGHESAVASVPPRVGDVFRRDFLKGFVRVVVRHDTVTEAKLAQGGHRGFRGRAELA